MSESINIQNPIILDLLSDLEEFQNIPLEEYIKISNNMTLLGIKNFKPINITKGCKKIKRYRRYKNNVGTITKILKKIKKL